MIGARSPFRVIYTVIKTRQRASLSHCTQHKSRHILLEIDRILCNVVCSVDYYVQLGLALNFVLSEVQNGKTTSNGLSLYSNGLRVSDAKTAVG